ncbi:NUDIX hydrolase [Roseateles amylovorans]|uniref:NUDIX domain-containing protein n=1 Tax=Roseateles amylovorans TaxID=2978473 RepID=A0ABY6B1Y4_9BURK|nr:NUDIX domain-containing protein [Roseateles amylovorans]UXH79410.1 NUDIX domain-containing protein [Roseateles amylovorans]
MTRSPVLPSAPLPPPGDAERPIVTVDIVLLTILDGRLQAGLTQREREPAAGAWTLPGGWVHTDEDQDADDAAVRILRDKAGLESPYLEQLRTFSGKHRDSRGWSLSIAYYAMVPGHICERDNLRFRWAPIDAARSLPFDHAEILRTAVERVRSKTLYSSLPVHLMPETFTLSQLQLTYEHLLEMALDKRSFRRRIEELNVIEEIDGAFTTGAGHRPAQLYRRRPHAARLATSSSNLPVA